MGINEQALVAAEELLERAVSSPKGIKVTCTSEGHAYQLRQKCYTFRERARRQASKVYQPDDPRYGKSHYDGLTILKPALDSLGKWYIHILHADQELNSLIVEEL